MVDAIPKVLHQIWVGSEPSQEIYRLHQTWVENHPNWEVHLWTDENLRIKGNRKAFEAASSPAMKADIARIELLKEFGGLYVDIDFQCHHPIDSLLAASNLVLLSQGYGITNSFAAGVPGHSFFAQLSRNISLLEVQDFAKTTQILTVTGPLFWTRTLATSGLVFDPQVRILAPEYLLPPKTKNPGLINQLDSLRYATHLGFATWRKKNWYDGIRRTKLKTRIRRFFDLGAE